MNKTDTKKSELTPQQFQAVCLLANGETGSSVASKLDVSRQTVSGWQNHNFAFQNELTLRKEEMWRETRQELQFVLPRALKVLIECLDDDNRRIQMSAAKTLLSLSGLEALKVAEPLPTIQPQQTFDEQIEELRLLGVFEME